MELASKSIFLGKCCFSYRKLHPIMQMCEQAAEAHKSKGSIHSSRRSRTSSDPNLHRKSSIDAIFDSHSSTPLSQVHILFPFFCSCFFTLVLPIFPFLDISYEKFIVCLSEMSNLTSWFLMIMAVVLLM